MFPLLRTAGRTRVAFISGITCAVVLLFGAMVSSCGKHSGPASEADTFLPGTHVAGVRVAIDDSAATVAKLGAPDYISHLPGNGIVFMYVKKGIGVQFGGLGSVYHSPLDKDTTVSEIFLFPDKEMDGRKFSMCTLRTPAGMTLQSTGPEIFKLYGDPPFLQVANGRGVDEQMTGAMFYPGMLVTFREGKISIVTIMQTPPADSAIRERVVSQPILPGESLGGVKMGMSQDDVRRVLGETHLKYKKLRAEFWFYPQYAVKVQFGIPPIEGQKSEQYFDSTLVGHVTGITGVSKRLFEGQLCPVAYQGRTPQGLGIGEPASKLRLTLGEPIRFVPKANAGIIGGYPYYVYKGVAYFVDPQNETIHHVIVTDEKLPLEMPL